MTINLTVNFDYSNDTAFSFDPMAPVETYNLDEVSLPFGKNEATASWRSLFKGFGKCVVGVDTTKSGGFCFTDKIWTRLDAKSIMFPPPQNILGYANAGYWLLSQTAVRYHPLDEHPVTLVSYTVANVRYVAVVAQKSVAGECLGFNDMTTEVGGVKLPYPIQTKSGCIPLGMSTASVRFRLEVSEDYRILCFAVDDADAKRVLVQECPSGYTVHASDAYLTLARIVERMLLNRKLSLTLVTLFQPKLSAVNVSLIGVHGKRQVNPDVPVSDFRPYASVVLEGYGELPDAPDGYVWVADALGVLYAISIDGQDVRMPYDLIDISHMIENAPSTDEPVARRMYLQEVLSLQRLFAHQEALLRGIMFNYNVLRGTDVDIPDED